jgi:fumarate hydratase subunit beta
MRQLKIGDQLEISGTIYTGRDAALPLLVSAIKDDECRSINIDLVGSVIFHTAVSIAGIGPTTSSKVEIEESIPALAAAGVRIHIGKGSISNQTVMALKLYNSAFAVTPPVSALLTNDIVSKKLVAFGEQGMEAIYELRVNAFPAIIASCRGKSIYI